MLALAVGGCSTRGTAEQPKLSADVASSALAAGDPHLALHVTDLILAQHPDDATALTVRGDALYALGQSDAARDAYRAAVKQDARNAQAQIGLGRTLLHSDPKAAVAAFSAASTLQPNNPVPLNDLGVARDLLQQHASAQEAYRAALALEPNSTEVRVNLGLSLALSGQGAQALATLRPLNADAGARPIWRANLAVAMALNGDREGARRMLAAQTEAPVAKMSFSNAAPSLAPAPPLNRPPAATAPAGHVRAQTPAAAAPDGGAWIQLASVPAEQDIAPEWERLQARFAFLRGKPLTIATGEVNGRTWWRLRIGGFSSLADAKAMCGQLAAEGAACLPLASPQT